MIRHLALCAAALLLWSPAGHCMADLQLTLQKFGTDQVRISWEGSGTVGGPSTIGTQNNLDFVDFLGRPFGGDITEDGSGFGHVFDLSTPLTLTIHPGTANEFSQTYSQVRLDNEIGSDLSLIGVYTRLNTGDTFEASGSATVELERFADNSTGEQLSFADLSEGSYFTDVASDAGVFGGATLTVTAVPEASAVFCFAATTALVVFHRGRRRNL